MGVLGGLKQVYDVISLNVKYEYDQKHLRLTREDNVRISQNYFLVCKVCIIAGRRKEEGQCKLAMT